MVPDEGIEPPTFGLQNRCSTAELIRRRIPRNPEWGNRRSLGFGASESRGALRCPHEFSAFARKTAPKDPPIATIGPFRAHPPPRLMR